MKPAKHYIEEWERYPDLYVFEITSHDNLYAAQRVASKIAERFNFPTPSMTKNCRRYQTCICENEVEPNQATLRPSRITLCADFAAGQLLHELAHAWCFCRYGDHDHGRLFQCALDDICYWFRLDEECQHWLFP